MNKIVLKGLLAAILLSVFAFRPVPAHAQDADLNEIVEFMREMMPISFGDCEMTDVYIDYNELVLVYDVDESIVSIPTQIELDSIKKELLKEMASAESGIFYLFIDELLKTSRGLQQVYIGKNTGNSFSYAITNRELSQTVNNRIVDPIKRLSSLILFTDYKLPMDYGNGLVNTKLEIGRTKWGNYVVYIYDCDEDMIDIELLQNNALMKEMLLEKNNTDNPATSYFRKTCKNAGFGIAYLYVGKTSGKVAEIFLPTDELK